MLGRRLAAADGQMDTSVSGINCYGLILVPCVLGLRSAAVPHAAAGHSCEPQKGSRGLARTGGKMFPEARRWRRSSAMAVGEGAKTIAPGFL